MILAQSSQIIANILLVSQAVSLISASDWSDDDHNHQEHIERHYDKNPPKDRILLRETKTLVFQRNKRTTSRRTHPIHQLSCVGGTAGCKLFTPDLVECENIGYDQDKSKINWRCHSEIGDRVQFNHQEIICEGYDYPEDDYILVGSCGLEFTLDYADPRDHHEKSYYKHMDEHEKEMHQAKLDRTPVKRAQGFLSIFNLVIGSIMNNALISGGFILLVLCSLVLVKVFNPANKTAKSKRGTGHKSPGYGPLTSAVLTTKKMT